MDTVCVNAIQSTAGVAPSHDIFNGEVCVVAATYSLRMRTAGWTHDQYNLASVIQEMDALCVNAMLHINGPELHAGSTISVYRH